MKYGVNLNALIPVRGEAKESSEMVTQLLFGEFFEVHDKIESFVKIVSSTDRYTGWIDEKMLTEISESDFLALQAQACFRVCMPVAEVFSLSDKTIFRLPAGSFLPNYDSNTSKFGVGDVMFQIHPSFVTYLPESNVNGIIPISTQFLNAPYLWGGKSVFGIDCSGFVQVVFSLNGISIPRDASQQVLVGEAVSFEDAVAGDLFFFEKDGKIVHVGIYMGDGKIIHASGRVKIDNVDSKGILSQRDCDYSHVLSKVRRFI